MREIVLVAMGGAAGASARYLVNSAAVALSGTLHFPVGTIIANLTGCFLVGAVGAWCESVPSIPQEIRLLLITGLLGGFTTFSAFGLETFALLRAGLFASAGMNVALHLIGGMALVWIGWVVVRAFQ